MTRFLMNLDEAVELVVFAFKNANPGDLFIQKADASTVGDLAIACNELFNGHSEIKVIGIRHSEKMYETLLTKEECIHAEDLGDYYRVPMDARDLNYEVGFKNWKGTNTLEEFNSSNTKLLNIEEIKEKLLTTDYVREALEDWNK